MQSNTAVAGGLVSDRRKASGITQGPASLTVLHKAPALRERLTCLDAYRGFVILVMTWVNFLGEMPGIPDWLKHATATQDSFTFPDLVFPGFLFIVGIAIPLALAKVRDPSTATRPLIFDIFWRSLGLIFIGVMLINLPRYDATASVLPRALYCVLFYVSMMLMWTQTGKRSARFWVGAALMAFLVLTFKGTIDTEFHTTHLESSWWGILGMIGWTYLCCSLVYVATRGNSTALMGAFAFMIAVYMGGQQGMLDFIPAWIENLLGVSELFGSISANVLAGTLVGNLFVDGRIGVPGDAAAYRAIHLRRLKFMFFFAAGMIIAGILLRPYHHISKIHATESFTLVCGGINLCAFMVFYVLMDVLKWRAWAAFLVPVGANALLAYIVPDLWRQMMFMLHTDALWWSGAWPYLDSGGTAGLLNAAVIALLMFGLAAAGTRAGLKLKF